MPFDVFISYSSKDKTTADATVATLEAQGVRCWVAPRDVEPGMEYGESILDGIMAAPVFVLIFSENANNSQHVRREVERAVNKEKIIVPFRITDALPTRAMEYCLGNTHWLDAMNPPLEKHLKTLSHTVRGILDRLAKEDDGKGNEKKDEKKKEEGRGKGEGRSEQKKRGVPVGVYAVLILGVLVGGVALASPKVRGWFGGGEHVNLDGGAGGRDLAAVTTPTPAPTATATPTPKPTDTPKPTATATSTPTAVPTTSPTHEPTPTAKPVQEREMAAVVGTSVTQGLSLDNHGKEGMAVGEEVILKPSPAPSPTPAVVKEAVSEKKSETRAVSSSKRERDDADEEKPARKREVEPTATPKGIQKLDPNLLKAFQ